MSADAFGERTDPLLDDVVRSLDDGLLPVSVITDEALYNLELERIFTRAWIFVGHESEIPSRGDYVHRYMGKDAFVLVRGEDGQVRLLFDSCRHRGAMICRAEKGNASHFRCSYHGWTYKNTGALVGAPLVRRAYGDSLNLSQWGLLEAPHLASLHGFIFASLDPDAPPFEEYLGDMKWYFDLIFGQLKEGWEVVGEPQRWVMDSNWKVGAENFSGDDYHVLYLHRSISELGLLGLESDDAGIDGTHHIQAGNGHSYSQVILPPGIPDAPRFWNWPEADDLFEPRLGKELYDLAERTMGGVGTIFPNFSFLSFPLQQVRETGPLATQVVRVWLPRSPLQVEVVNWLLVPRGLDEAAKDLSRRAALGTFGSSGIFDQDDSEPWGSITRTASSQFARKARMRLNYQMGMDGSAGDSARVEDGAHPGPGIKYHPGLEEGVMRGYWRRWAQFMKSRDYPCAMTAAQQNGDEKLDDATRG